MRTIGSMVTPCSLVHRPSLASSRFLSFLRAPLDHLVGREIDLAVLQAAEPTMKLDDWLRACADAAVIEALGTG